MPSAQNRKPSVVHVPALCIRGDAAAQALEARLTAGQTELGRMGVVTFWSPSRRDLVMQLPTTSGGAVLAAFEKSAKTLISIPENRREAFLHALVVDLVKARWNVDCRRLWFAVSPSEAFPEAELPKEPEQISQWYSRTYEHQAARDADIAKKKADVDRFPGREWRAGRAQDTGRDSQLYPALSSAPWRPSTMRAKVQTEVRRGEQWAHPGDTGALWPGVSASHRANPVPPKLTGGDDMEARDYCCMPLARRVDLDRVLNTLLEFPSIFKLVKVTGEGGFAYKSLPWTHMNPYHINCQIQLTEVASSQSSPTAKTSRTDEQLAGSSRAAR